MVSRSEVYAAIDGEREYQDKRWTEGTTASRGIHSLEEWFAYIGDYVNEAEHILARENKQDADPKALGIMRKVTAMGVCAMEQHGAPSRVAR